MTEHSRAAAKLPLVAAIGHRHRIRLREFRPGSYREPDAQPTADPGDGRGEDGWVVAGQRFSLSALTSYDLVMTDEIRASIEESLLR